MFTIAKSALRPTLTRSLIVPFSYTTSFHTLPVLPYEYNALEPHISEEIMKLHHQKHHQTYINGLNTAEEAYAKSNSTTEQIALQSALKFNGGEPDYIHDSSSQFPNHSYLEAHGLTYTGHINHSLFWKNLAPANAEGGKIQSGPLKSAIERDFGSVEAFKQIFNTKTAAIQGSGWGWLGYNSSTRGLEVVTTANQDPLISHIPIIGVDIWEHAFYLQYKNLKPDYLKAIWNIINFKEAEQRFTEAQ